MEATNNTKRTCEKKGHVIEGGMVVDYPIPDYDMIPCDSPEDHITLWVGKSDFYYKPFGYVPDEHGHIHIPVTSDLAKAAGVCDGITLHEAKKKIDEYVGEQFMTRHYVKVA